MIKEDAKSLRQEIEAGLAAGLNGATLLVLFKAYADTMQARLDTLKEQIVSLDALSLTDALTGIKNRRALDMHLTAEIGQARRGRKHLAVIFIDIDKFKGYNDVYGHAAGDITLKSIAAVLVSTLRRPGDFVARYGGEEFVAILPGLNTYGALVVAEHLRSAVRGMGIEHLANEGRGIVTASFGVVSVTPASDEASALPTILELADRALRCAKSEGRDRISISETITGKMPNELDPVSRTVR
jgi:diguanylate cyclase (GGDEF)-like protein